MHFSQRILMAAVTALAIAGSTGAARANGFIGSWPVTVSHSQRDNGTFCLTLNGTGTTGQASLVAGGQKYPYGSYIVIDNIMSVTISEPLYGQNGALMFIVHTKHAHIGNGLFENIEGGSNFDAGDLAFGEKGGC